MCGIIYPHVTSGKYYNCLQYLLNLSCFSFIIILMPTSMEVTELLISFGHSVL